MLRRFDSGNLFAQESQGATFDLVCLEFLQRKKTSMKKVTAGILVVGLCACAAIAAPVKVKADSLLKTNDVETVMGKLKGAPKPDTGLMGESICKYENADGQWVNVSVY